jgi:hypothetical protein
MSDARPPLEAHEIVETWRREFEESASDEALQWVSLAQAERESGVSRSTMRAWFRSGELPSRLEPGPHGPQRLVPLEAVLDMAQRSPARGRQRRRAPSVGFPDGLAALVESLTARAEARAAAAEAALRVALERAAAAEAELRVLRDPNLRQ